VAGTLPNLPLSTQFDKDSGRPLKGGKLIFYVANAPSSPLVAYKDSGLTLPWGDRLTLDGAGRVPMFYLPDGNVGIRLTSKAGVVQVEESNLLVIGPSSGEGGGGGGVDPETIFKTGDVIALDQSGARSGWVRDNGRTIGSASSGASERANSDCQALFLFLWAAYADVLCPVVGGRGANAAADWAADKQITLPDKRGRVMAGLDDMGNSAANRLTGVPITAGSATTAGALGGEATHTLATSEIPAHTHTATVTDPGHLHNIGQIFGLGGGPVNTFVQGAGTANTGSSVTGVTVANANTGGGGAHNTMPLFFLGTWYRKL
jgi:microcystin-dependent protein